MAMFSCGGCASTTYLESKSVLEEVRCSDASRGLQLAPVLLPVPVAYAYVLTSCKQAGDSFSLLLLSVMRLGIVQLARDLLKMRVG